MSKKLDYSEINRRRTEKLAEKTTVPGTTRRTPQTIEDIKLNVALINCRSLKPKIKSLKECFKMNKLSLAILNETWLYKSDRQFKCVQQNLKYETGIDFIRRDRDSRGGGVAVAFDANEIVMKKLNLNSLKNEKQA